MSPDVTDVLTSVQISVYAITQKWCHAKWGFFLHKSDVKLNKCQLPPLAVTWKKRYLELANVGRSNVNRWFPKLNLSNTTGVEKITESGGNSFFWRSFWDATDVYLQSNRFFLLPTSLQGTKKKREKVLANDLCKNVIPNSREQKTNLQTHFHVSTVTVNFWITRFICNSHQAK
jgi:hypothetical protein